MWRAFGRSGVIALISSIFVVFAVKVAPDPIWAVDALNSTTCTGVYQVDERVGTAAGSERDVRDGRGTLGVEREIADQRRWGRALDK